MLIKDLIRISHLDEGVEIPKEEVDLLAVVKEIAVSLQIPALKKGVSIHVTGEACRIMGGRGLLYEIVLQSSSGVGSTFTVTF